MAENTMQGFSGKRDKMAVNYRASEKCQMCDSYRNTKCTKVSGGISPEAMCDLWQLGEIPTGFDGEFYIKEFDKKSK